MSDVFISYSRKNSTFARRLIDCLSLANKDAWVDWEGIPLTAPNWWSEIKAGIEGADSFVFILSPDSMASVVCNMELDYAIELHKRIVPVVYMDVVTRDAFASLADFTPDAAMEERLNGKDVLTIARDNWQRLSHINWVFFRETDDFDAAFETLVKTVETDLEYVKAHTRYLIRAQEWVNENWRADLLIFGSEIDRAEAWLQKGEGYAAAATGPEKVQVVNPLPDELHREYIRASRQADTRRRRLVRSAQLSIAVLVVVLIAGFGIGSSIINQTQEQAANIQATSAQNVALAEAKVEEAVTAVADANSQLTAVPPTLTQVGGQVATAQGQADAAATQIADANRQLATATQALVTATHIADQAAAGQATLSSVSTQVVVIEATVTQAAIIQDIMNWTANTLLEQGNDPDGRMADMTFLVEEVYPNQSLAWYARGIIYAAQGNLENAIADYDEAIRLNPEDANAYNNRGFEKYRLGNIEGAITDYDEAIRLDPENANLYINRGDAKQEIGDLVGAIADYNEAIRLKPEYYNAYHGRGIVKGQVGDFEGAIADFDEVIRLYTENVVAYSDRGLAKYNLGDLEGAIADYDEALRLDPEYVDAYMYRGGAKYDLGDFEGAISDWHEVERLGYTLPQELLDVLAATEAE